MVIEGPKCLVIEGGKHSVIEGTNVRLSRDQATYFESFGYRISLDNRSLVIEGLLYIYNLFELIVKVVLNIYQVHR